MSTPPMLSTTLANPPKPISTYPSMRSPVDCSRVCVSSSGPPMAKAALTLFSRLPGIGRKLSRGTEMRAERPEPDGTWTRMIESVRRPSAFPVPSVARCSAVSPSRLSLPTSR